MIRSPLLVAALLSITLATACSDDASEMQRDANKAQGVADEKIDEANVKADQEIRTAQAEADLKIAAVRADFTTLREEYRHDITLKLVELDKKVADVEARAMKANGEQKAELETKLKVIRSERDAFMSDYKTLENESAATWDATKARLDREWSALDARVNGA